jgi:hypothetical protein
MTATGGRTVTMRTCILTALLSLLWTLPVRAGEAATSDLDILRDAIRANKKALVAASLKLTDDEAAKFWPAYDSYEKDLKAVNDRLVALLQDYTAGFPNITDEKAMSLVDQYLSVESDRVKVRRDHLADFAKAIPGRKVARFYQIENKMDAVVKYDLASTIPVVAQ